MLILQTFLCDGCQVLQDAGHLLLQTLELRRRHHPCHHDRPWSQTAILFDLQLCVHPVANLAAQSQPVVIHLLNVQSCLGNTLHIRKSQFYMKPNAMMPAYIFNNVITSNTVHCCLFAVPHCSEMY